MNVPRKNMPAFPSAEIFRPGNESAYLSWREQRLAVENCRQTEPFILLDDWPATGGGVVDEIIARCDRSNMAFYHVRGSADKIPPNETDPISQKLKAFCAALGLRDREKHRSQDDDGIVAINVKNKGVGSGYVPYTKKPLNWHTDGYYNAADDQIKGMVLHCVRDATDGGENEFLDPQLAYIALRDANPAYIEALMHEEAMIIPENTDQRSAYRAKSIGPVFFLDPVAGRLNMRYSARMRNIIWRDDQDTEKARAMLVEIMRDSPYIIRHKLQPGQGIISNNVLHNRTGFDGHVDGGDGESERLLLRIRFKHHVGCAGNGSGL